MPNLVSDLGQPFFYKGQSMAPTFWPGDVLHVHRLERVVVPGDVIVFQRPNDTEPVVHRIMRVVAGEYITRGDNNRRSDPLPITAAEVIGHVVACESDSEIRWVPGGWRGLLAAQTGWTTRGLAHQLRRLLWRPYHALRGSSFSRAVLNRLFRNALTAVRLESPEGSIVKIAFRRHTVALYYPGQNRFICRKPFDLFISPPTDRN